MRYMAIVTTAAFIALPCAALAERAAGVAVQAGELLSAKKKPAKTAKAPKEKVEYMKSAAPPEPTK